MFRLIFETFQVVPTSPETTTANVGVYDKPVGAAQSRVRQMRVRQMRVRQINPNRRKRRKWSVLDD